MRTAGAARRPVANGFAGSRTAACAHQAGPFCPQPEAFRYGNSPSGGKEPGSAQSSASRAAAIPSSPAEIPQPVWRAIRDMGRPWRNAARAFGPIAERQAPGGFQDTGLMYLLLAL